MKHFNLLVAFAAIVLFVGCEKDFIPQEGIVMGNSEQIQGTYIITGPHSYWEKTTKWLSSPPQGEYTVNFSNMEVNKNVCSIDGRCPVFVGSTTFVVSSSYQTVSVPVREVTCKLSFKGTDGVKISKILVNNVPTTLFIDGEFGQPSSMQLSGDSYVIASDMEVSICIDVLDDLGKTKDIKVLKSQIDAKPGKSYTLKVGENDISVVSN